MSFKTLVSSAIVLVVVMMGLFGSGSDAQAQDKKKPSLQSQPAMLKLAELQRLVYDPKLADEVELTPDQKKKIQIALQKHQDAAQKMARPEPGAKIDRSEFQKLAEAMVEETRGILSEKQEAKLSVLTKERMKASPGATFSTDNVQEVQKLNSMMMELVRLSYDHRLAEELEVTAEQRVEIREAQQKFQQAMQERMKAGQGQEFDLNSYNEMMDNLMMDAQDILRPEQSAKLARAVKLKGLKQRFGDEFAMVNGLAEEFDLDAKQKLELREKIDEVREEFYDKLLTMKKESMQKIIRQLPSEHRKEVEEAVSKFLNDDPRKKQDPFSGAFQMVP